MADLTGNVMADLDDVPAREAGKFMVGKADNSGYEPRSVVDLDLTGAAGTMSFQYDAATNKAKVAPLAPVLLSTGATGAGRALVGNGAFIVDIPVKAILSGSANPTASDGWDGAYWVNTSTKEVFGPRGESTAGQWPSSPRRDVKLVTSGSDSVKRATLEQPLDLGGLASGNDNVWAGTQPGGEPIKAIAVTNFAHFGTSSASDGYVGLDVIVGTETMANVTLRPQGAANTNLKLAGLNSGKVIGSDSTEIQTVAQRQAYPYFFTGVAAVTLGVGVGSATLLTAQSGTTDSQGTWTQTAYVSGTSGGWAAPEAGIYTVRVCGTIKDNATTSGSGWFAIAIDGTIVTAKSKQFFYYSNTYTQVSFLSGPISVAAGQDIGVLMYSSSPGGSTALATFNDAFSLEIVRIA